MKTVRVLTQILDRFRLSWLRQRRTPPITNPMSDRELALAIRDIKQRQQSSAPERAKQMRMSAIAQLRRLEQSVKQQDALSTQRSHEMINVALELLRDPGPDTFLGRRAPNMLSQKGWKLRTLRRLLAFA